MKTVIVLSVVAALAMAPAAHAGGFFGKKTTNVLSNITGVVASVATKDINLLNGTTVAVGNNSTILSGISVGNGVLNGNANGNSLLNGVLGGNGILGLGGQNKKRFGW
jgi:hypothetical protein